MRGLLRNAMTLTAIAVGMNYACMAQTAATQPTQTASVDSPASPAAATPVAGADATHPASAAAQPEIQPTVSQEIDALKNRIDQLENEVQEEKARALADSSDTAAIKAAEKELVAGNGGSALNSAKIMTGVVPSLQAAVPAPTEPASPEIGAQTTTKGEPFPGDWTWLNSNGHATDSPMSTKYFTPEFRADANYIFDYNHPIDDTMGGATESFRSDEWQLEQISIGGDIRINNVRGRILTMDGLFATTTPRNDGSVNRGNWDLAGAYKYVSEAWGGYHWDVAHGLNVDAGIFVSYIGLFSYYNFDNWTYQPSFVSSNTPWFFNGLRIQYFPTAKLKIEPWIINGWQSYARFGSKPGLGGQILWRPTNSLDLVFNNYGLGEDDSANLGRSRVHADYSLQYKAYDQPTKFLDKIAFTVTGDAGCEYGGGPVSFSTPDGAINPHGFSPEKGTTDTYNGGVRCHGSEKATGKPKQAFLGYMIYNRYWFKHDLYAITLGGGVMNNPGRYLTLLPPINGATAVTGTPYYTENAGDRSQMHDGTVTFDYMPSQFITFRLEEGYRYSDTPYWTGHGGITPPGGDNGSPAQYACASGGASGFGYGTVGLASAEAFCHGGTEGASTADIWWPDLRTNQTNTTIAIMVRF
jgi:Putative beta-barrel porin-2, OmpL-like. bbp2